MKTFRNVALALVILVFISVLAICTIYNIQKSPVDKKDNKEIKVVIEPGSTSKKIASVLKNNDLIRNEKFFLLYIKINKVNNLKASTYIFKKSMSLEEIIKVLEKGNSFNPDQITITFKEGINMRKIASIIEQKTNNSYDEVFNTLKDEEYIDLLISKYWFLKDIIKNNDIYYPLEGYLFPDTYNFKDKNVTVKEIFEVMLNKMDKELTKLKTDIEEGKLSIHDILTLSSIIELEGGVKRDANGVIIKDDRPGIASVFYNRLKNKMSLGSDVTTYYASRIDITERDLYTYELNTSNPYNTRGPGMEGRLPVGPISTVGVSSINAAVNPTTTDYFYFVADKYNNTYFTKTYAEHLAKIKELKEKGVWFEYDR